MTLRKFFIGKAIGFIMLLVVVLIVGGFYAFNNYIYQQKQGTGAVVEPYRATLSGTYVCLPHRDTSGPQTLECAFGIKTDAGEYYGVDFVLMSQIPPELNVGDQITANGVIIPLERVSPDYLERYSIAGIFSITDSVKKE